MTQVAIVESGLANLASIKNAFHTLGIEHSVVDNPEDVLAGTHVVLPGVGAFGAGMARLRENRLDDALREVAARGTPLLAVCLGMQLLGRGSEESPGVPGLGLLEADFHALPAGVRTPQQGWNAVVADPGSSILTSGDAAFSNAFCLTRPPTDWETAWTHHGVRFVSALARGSVVACQFHPELSGEYGLSLMARWLGRQGTQTREASISGPIAARRLIACLDVRGGRVVKGVRFQDLRDAGDPSTQALRHAAGGADEIVVLDVAATPEARDTQLQTVAAVRRRLHIPLTVGGGIRTPDDARRVLAAGADKVSVNSAAVRNPRLLEELAQRFGRQCVVLAIDARRTEAG